MSDLEDLIYERDEEIKRLQHKLADSVIERGDLTKELDRLEKENQALREQARALREALRFYADPKSHPLNGEWRDEYPGGITYEKGDSVFVDNGELAQQALKERGHE